MKKYTIFDHIETGYCRHTQPWLGSNIMLLIAQIAKCDLHVYWPALKQRNFSVGLHSLWLGSMGRRGLYLPAGCSVTFSLPRSARQNNSYRYTHIICDGTLTKMSYVINQETFTFVRISEQVEFRLRAAVDVRTIQVWRQLVELLTRACSEKRYDFIVAIFVSRFWLIDVTSFTCTNYSYLANLTKVVISLVPNLQDDVMTSCERTKMRHCLSLKTVSFDGSWIGKQAWFSRPSVWHPSKPHSTFSSWSWLPAFGTRATVCFTTSNLQSPALNTTLRLQCKCLYCFKQ